ncbi:MAG: glycerophosphoryl diester phosphodiesterase membrane domain-containing protein, partial [Candidatus Nanopelagicales bacterium]
PAPKPGVIPLHPLSVGEMIAGTIDYVRRDPKTVIAISAIVGFVAAAAQLVVLGVGVNDTTQMPTDPASVTPEVLWSALSSLIVTALITSALAGVLQVLGTGMLAHVMGRSAIGQRTSIGQAWHLIKPQALRLIVATITVSVIVALALVLPLLPGALLLRSGATTAGGAVLFAGGLIALVLTVWASIGLVLTTPALALEDARAMHALKRSWILVKGAFWRTLGIVLLGTIVGQAIGSVAAAPFSLIGGAGGELTTVSVFALAMGGLVSVLVALPFIAGVITLVYIDRRIRSENLAGVLLASAQSAAAETG